MVLLEYLSRLIVQSAKFLPVDRCAIGLHRTWIGSIKPTRFGQVTVHKLHMCQPKSRLNSPAKFENLRMSTISGCSARSETNMFSIQKYRHCRKTASHLDKFFGRPKVVSEVFSGRDSSGGAQAQPTINKTPRAGRRGEFKDES